MKDRTKEQRNNNPRQFRKRLNKGERTNGLARAHIGSIVHSSRRDGAIFLMIPGTSCLATIVLSLRDKGHSPIEALHNYLSACASRVRCSQALLLSVLGKKRPACRLGDAVEPLGREAHRNSEYWTMRIGPNRVNCVNFAA